MTCHVMSDPSVEEHKCTHCLKPRAGQLYYYSQSATDGFLMARLSEQPHVSK